MIGWHKTMTVKETKRHCLGKCAVLNWFRNAVFNLRLLPRTSVHSIMCRLAIILVFSLPCSLESRFRVQRRYRQSPPALAHQQPDLFLDRTVSALCTRPGVAYIQGAIYGLRNFTLSIFPANKKKLFTFPVTFELKVITINELISWD